MDLILSPAEVRVLGALVEKELTTPEYCPLTLNSLLAACNQKSNRDPVTSLTEREVGAAIEALRGRALLWLRNMTTSRVFKYESNLSPRFGFSLPQTSILCVLMLRGPCTPGELRTCGSRMHPFADLAEVDATVQKLLDHEGGPFVVKLPRQPGRKEHRFAHLFSGSVTLAFEEAAPATPAPSANDHHPVSTGHDRLTQVEEKVSQLTDEIAALRAAFQDFKKAFE